MINHDSSNTIHRNAVCNDKSQKCLKMPLALQKRTARLRQLFTPPLRVLRLDKSNSCIFNIVNLESTLVNKIEFKFQI